MLQVSAACQRITGVEWRLLQEVPDEEVRRLLAVARRRTFRRGEVVFHQNDPADSLHLIVKGRFAIRVMTPFGDQTTIALRGPGESFGEMALVGAGARRSATVEALEAAETFCVYQAEFERLRRAHPSVTELVIAFLASEVRMLNARLLEALYVPVERRVLRRLDELARSYERGARGLVEIPLTQEEIAGLAGTSRATVNAVLREAQERGLIKLGRGRVQILDAESLAERARRP
jgi:CRP-like cAMP-binding protein